MSPTTMFLLIMTAIVMLSITINWTSSHLARRYAVPFRKQSLLGSKHLQSRKKAEQALADLLFNTCHLLIAVCGIAWLTAGMFVIMPAATKPDHFLIGILLACAAMAGCYGYNAWRAYQTWRDE